MKKNRKLYLSIAAVLVILLAAGSLFIKTPQGKANANTRDSLMDISIPVTTTTLEKGQLEDTIFAIGSVQPSATYTVNAKVNGDVEAVYFNIGDTVKEGDVLFRMKDHTFNSEKASQSQSLKNQLDLAKISYDQTSKSYNDTKVLFNSGAVSSDALDQAELAYKTSKASYENTRLNYNASISGLSDQTDTYLVKSPVNGLITDRNMEAGMSASGQNGFTIIVDDSLKIDATVASKYISQVAVGQGVDIYVNTLDKHFEGQLTSVSYAAQKGSYPVEIMFNETDDTIYTGMFAELKIEIASRDNILLLPIDALIKEGNTSYVFKVIDGVAIKAQVTTGIRSNKIIEVSGDLSEGDVIVIEGKEFLKENTKVVVE